MATDLQSVRDDAKPQRPPLSLERFLDAFLQESNIKWMLVIGAAICAASSLMFVTRHWSDMSVPLKYAIVLTYTAATYGIAEFSNKRLHLIATSQVLKMLTLLLMPLGFLSMSWFIADESAIGITNLSLMLLMLIPAGGLMVYAGDRIFKHWLQGRQTTFVAAYMMLCLAGAMPIIQTTWLAVLFVCGFWSVMTLGVLKVNRHLFWLAEENKWPRVFGFFPIAILSTQFVVLYATKTFQAIPFHWMGLGIVMLAATILLTTRTIASVFKQRTGDLVRPLPLALIVPLFTGLLLVATGVLLSFHGFQFVGQSTLAVVPTAILAAGLLMTVAKDTRHQGFVWAGLILIAIAYQSTPTLFVDIVQQIKSTAAHAVGEERLPIAFYGLTYMPLLVGLAIASRLLNDRKRFEFSVPMRSFVTLISVLLFTLALTNLKAAFIVSVVCVAAFALFAVLFRDRTYVLPAIGSMVVAVAMCVPYLNVTGTYVCELSASLTAIASFGLVLASQGFLDSLVNRIPLPTAKQSWATRSSLMVDAAGQPQQWFRLVGQTIATSVVIGWFLPMFAVATLRLDVHTLPAGWPIVAGLMLASAMLFRGRLVTFTVVIVAPVVAGIGVGYLAPSLFTHQNLPLIYAITIAAMAVFFKLRNSDALLSICMTWMTLLIVLGMVFLSPLTFAASALSLCVIGYLTYERMTAAQRSGFAIVVAAQTIFAMAMLSGFTGLTASLPISAYFAPACAWMLVGVVLTIVCFDHEWKGFDADVLRYARITSRCTGVILFMQCVHVPSIGLTLDLMITLSLLIAAANEFRAAVRTQVEPHVGGGFAVFGMMIVWMTWHHALPLSPLGLRITVVSFAGTALLAAQQCAGHERFGILVRSLRAFGLGAPIAMALWSLSESRHGAAETLVVLATAMILFVYGRVAKQRRYVIGAAMMMNAGILAMLDSLSLSDPQFYLVPVGLTVIGLVELLRNDLVAKLHDPLRYAGALMILVSPCFEILGGSWWHMVSLMVLSVLVILMAMGFQLKALLHLGTAFLFMDLVAMLIRSSIDNPGMLWALGLAIGAGVIALAAWCESHRENLMSRIRVLSAVLATWS